MTWTWSALSPWSIIYEPFPSTEELEHDTGRYPITVQYHLSKRCYLLKRPTPASSPATAAWHPSMDLEPQWWIPSWVLVVYQWEYFNRLKAVTLANHGTSDRQSLAFLLRHGLVLIQQGDWLVDDCRSHLYRMYFVLSGSTVVSGWVGAGGPSSQAKGSDFTTHSRQHTT